MQSRKIEHSLYLAQPSHHQSTTKFTRIPADPKNPANTRSADTPEPQAIPAYNHRLKMKWVWLWLNQLPMHWTFKNSESSGSGSGSDSGGSDGGKSYISIDEDGPDPALNVIEPGSEKVPLTGLIRRGKKRTFVEAAAGVNELTRGDKVRVFEHGRWRSIKIVRRYTAA